VNETPRVSIIIPTYNMEDHIGRTLDSVQDQSFRSFEVIVVDDASTDGTAEIVKDKAAQDNRFRYVRLENNSNRPAVPRNLALAVARGDYVAFLDHDDLWMRNKLERQVMVLDARPDVALVHSHLWEFAANSRKWGLLYMPNPYRRRVTYKLLLQGNRVQCSSVLARTNVLREFGGFDERPELRAVEDFHLWLRIAHRNRIAYISETHGFYRMSPSSTSSLENMATRLRYLDSNEGTQILSNSPSLLRRALRKMGGYPLAFYCHIIEARWRQGKGLMPRIFLGL